VGQRTVPTGVEDDVEPLPTAGDVVERVVDDVVCADGTDHVHFVVLQTPVTSAPNALAICTANVPTRPDAPMTSTFCPGCTCPLLPGSHHHLPTP